MVGQTGVADTELGAGGLGARAWASAGGPWPKCPVAAGERVTVASVEGLKLRVRKGA